MKTKIASFLTAAVVSLMTLATSSFADAEAGFYEKDHIRGFISIGADYRGMRDEFQKYVNTTAFANGEHRYTPPGDSVEHSYAGSLKYNSFDDYYLGLHVNIGAQYKQFLTWFDINFMPSQVSERPSSTYSASQTDVTAGSASGGAFKFPLYDVKWFSYGADWMFAWKLFGEDTFINLIPAVGFGFNLINFHLASNFDISDPKNDKDYATLRDRYYSTFATTVNSELELRLEFNPIAIGIYGGYRFIRYNELEAEGYTIDTNTYDTDNVGDTFFFGLRLTRIFKSEWQSKQENRL